MPRKASTIGKAHSTPVQPDLARSFAALSPYCKRRSISLVETLANKFHHNTQGQVLARTQTIWGNRNRNDAESSSRVAYIDSCNL